MKLILYPNEKKELIKERIKYHNERPGNGSEWNELKKSKISELRGKLSGLTNGQIDKQLKKLRNEWERNI
ncbi:MAG: hypothetical protein ABJA79_04340 [Parafilimonas sp.]